MYNKFILFLALFLALLVPPAQAQLSISGGPQYIFGTKNNVRLPLIGLEAKVAFDFSDHYTLGITANQLGYIRWEYVPNMDIGFGNMSMNVPFRVGSEQPLVDVHVNDFALLSTYYIFGTNISTAGAYASLGPGLRFYNAKVRSEANPDDYRKEKATDIILDMRVGGQVWIGIGWAFLEAKFAPGIIYPDRTDYYVHNHNPFFGGNLGIRFLLNAHPRCRLE